MNLQRGRWPEAFVAALASLSVGWPLTTLLEEASWIGSGIVMVAVVAISGALARSGNVGPSVVAVGQLGVGLLVLGWMFLSSTLWFGLPTFSSAGLAADLLGEAGAVLREYAAPAPTTIGVSFLVVSVLALTAIAVDAIGVTNAAPAIAGIPLAAAFLVSVSNNGEAMEPWFFLATTALWLAMVAQQSDRLIAHWPSADRHEFGTTARFGAGYKALARTLGLVGLVAALLIAAILPHFPPTFFGAGLARNPDATNLGPGTAAVSFTETMDPGEDLQNPSQAPVLEYTSTARLLPPLRVTSTAGFDGQTWQPPARDAMTVSGPALPPVTGLSLANAASEEEIDVTFNRLAAPHLAVPSPATAVRMDAAAFGYDESSGAILLERPVDEYSATYLEKVVDGTLAPVGPTAARVAQDEPDLLSIAQESERAVVSRAEEILGDEDDPLVIGRLLQSHLRGSSYTYSLELAPEQPGVSDDPISQFLASRQGYCVQFSTAMVMMARSRGIPARMAVGFLPGELQDDGSRIVVAADAHTWPELYVDGLGWTRFEPTPGVRTGLPPELTQVETPAEAAQEVPEVADVAPDEAPDAANSADDTSWSQNVSAWLVRWQWVFLALTLVALVLAAIPAVGRRYRMAESRRARTHRDYVESQWLILTRSLADLGVSDPGVKSPRAMRAHYEKSVALSGEGAQALDRVTGTLEHARYGQESTVDRPDEHMQTDVVMVLDAVREAAPWRTRLRAAALPRSGFAGIAKWTTNRTHREAHTDARDGDMHERQDA